MYVLETAPVCLLAASRRTWRFEVAFCPNCDTKLDEGARFCPSCGSSIKTTTPTGATGTTPSQPATTASTQPQPYQQAAVQKTESRVENPKYKNLGGWLLFFVVCWGLTALMGLASLARYVSMIAYFGDDYVMPAFGMILSTLASVALSITMCVSIVRRAPNFLRLYQILAIVNLGVSLLAAVPSASVTISSAAFATGASISTVAGAAVGLVLMTMYFCKSKRVRTYMGSTEYLDAALFKIGA